MRSKRGLHHNTNLMSLRICEAPDVSSPGISALIPVPLDRTSTIAREHLEIVRVLHDDHVPRRGARARDHAVHLERPLRRAAERLPGLHIVSPRGDEERRAGVPENAVGERVADRGADVLTRRSEAK